MRLPGFGPKLTAGQKLIKPGRRGAPQVGKAPWPMLSASSAWRPSPARCCCQGAGHGHSGAPFRRAPDPTWWHCSGCSRRVVAHLWQLMGALLFLLTLAGAIMGLVAGAPAQWLTLQLLGTCCRRICRLPPGGRSPWGSRSPFFITLLLAFVPFLRLCQAAAAAGCCAVSWRPGSSWLTVPR